MLNRLLSAGTEAGPRGAPALDDPAPGGKTPKTTRKKRNDVNFMKACIKIPLENFEYMQKVSLLAA